MSRRLFISTVGVSLLTNSLETKHEVDLGTHVDSFDNPLYDDDARPLLDWLRSVEIAALSEPVGGFSSVRRRLCDKLVAQRFDPAFHSVKARRLDYLRWSRTVGAELATLSRFSRAEGDAYALLPSETAEAVFCATLIATALSRWGWSQESDFTGSIRVVAGLSPASVRGFEQAMQHVLPAEVKAIVEKYDLGADDELVLVGSGGYKSVAAGLYQILLDESLPRHRWLTFLHEDTDDVVEYVPPRNGGPLVSVNRHAVPLTAPELTLTR